jgi:nicotinate-nucleotide pyrophosphorylase (carboxylating)
MPANEFSPAEMAASFGLIDLALQEDLKVVRLDADITTNWFVPSVSGSTAITARQTGIVAGLPVAALVFSRLDSNLCFTSYVADGSRVQPGDRLASIVGPMAGILAGERVALNFVQYLSGIATLTRQYVDSVAGLPVKILDTRKTLPGWRKLARYAVRHGGGFNHRMGLYDMILIKDNHWKAMPTPRNLPNWIDEYRGNGDPEHEGILIEIEVESLAQFDEVMAAKPDIILLDNMPLDMMRESVQRRNAVAPSVLLEASGGVNLQSVRAIAETGVDRISIGALTHSAPALDIALDYGA